MNRLPQLATTVSVLALTLAGCATDTTLAGVPSAHQTSVREASPGAATPSPEDTPSRPAMTPTPTPSASATPTPSETPTPSPSSSSATPTPSKSETPKPKAPAILKNGDSGDRVRELQHRLLQLDWYAGKITPHYGTSTEAAVQGFQGKRGLDVTGEVDQKTWDTLTGMTRKPTHDEMNNVVKPGPPIIKPGDKGDRVKDLQARLKQLDWYDKPVNGTYDAATEKSVKEFQAKRQLPANGIVDQKTLDKLNEMTSKPTTEQLTNKPPKKPTPPALDQRCMTGRVLCIDKGSNKMRWVIDGQVKQTLDVRFGTELTPTREGVFTLYWKSRDHVSTLYHTAMPFAMFFSGGQAVHYSADFAARGYNGGSHGCVNVRDKAGITWLFDQTREGDKVVVHP